MKSRLIIAIATIAAALGISSGIFSLPAAALMTPSSVTISNLPVGATFGDSGFVASVTTDSDGVTSVTSSTPNVCLVSLSDNLTVTYAGAGTCTLTAHVAASANFEQADGDPQSFDVAPANPSIPTITNLPTAASFGGSFIAAVDTNGDGTISVASNSLSVCTVSNTDGLTVNFVGVGTCSLTAQVGTGTNYEPGSGSPQSFSVAKATPSSVTISNLPASGSYLGGFTASVSTNGDGATSVDSNSLGVCTVSNTDGLTVTDVGVGTCSLTAKVAVGTEYIAAGGVAQTFQVLPALASAPSITNLPNGSTFGGSFVSIISTTGDGTKSVSSNSGGVCTVGPDGLAVTFVGVGMCSLTAHVAAGTNFAGNTALMPQSFSVSQASPSTPTISNLPASAAYLGGFTASVTTDGDGVVSVTSNSLGVCAVSNTDGLTVTYMGVGTCSLTANVTVGTDYRAAVGVTQTFGVLPALASAPLITNLPTGSTFGGSFAAAVGTTGDGTKSVSSNSAGVCTVGPDGLNVTFVAVGTCSLTAHVAAGTKFAGNTALIAQSFSVGRATPSSPSVANFPAGATEFTSFVAAVATTGDGAGSLASATSGVCTVGPDGLTVTFVGFGACTVTASVGQGAHYGGRTGSPQTFNVNPATRGYWLVGSDGGIFSFGAAGFHGSMGGIPLQRPVVGITPTASRHGYWLVASDGGIFSFGDSSYYGSIPGVGLHPAGSGQPNSLNAPIVGMVPSTSGHGYFMVASDGGVFAFGDARFAGSCPGIGGCYGTAVAVMPDSTGNGYWLVTNLGAVYAFGDAGNYGEPPPESVAAVDAVATPDGRGYWVLYANGVVFSFGDAGAMGFPLGYVNSFNPAAAIFPTADGRGYWVAAARGDVFSYGDAHYMGSMAAAGLNGQIIAGFGF